MKVLRSTLVAAVAVIAAACGDKVTVPPQTVATAQIRSVSVSPAATTLAVGQAVNLSVAVVADSGLSYTVSWSVSGSNVTLSNQSNTGATATAASATAGVAVCATATASGGQTGRGCGSIVVSTAAATVAPTASIASVNFTNGAGIQQPAPVPPGAIGTAVGVGPQLNVVMNVNAGTASLDSLVLLVGACPGTRAVCKTAYKQAFSASEAAAILNASNDGAAQAAPGITITGSFNTADYCATTNANGVTCTQQGQASWQNGNQGFQAVIYGKQSVTAGGAPNNVQGLSPVATYRFANLDGYHVTMTPGSGTNAPTDNLVSATDPAGFKWTKGKLDISALFVAYTPALSPVTSVLSTTATWGGSGCSPAAGLVQLTNTSTTSSAGPWTGTFILNTTTGATATAAFINGYEWRPATSAGCAGVAFTSGGEIVNLAAVGSDGNAVGLVAGTTYGGTIGAIGVGVLNTFASSNNPDPAIVFRIDNVAPPAPTLQLSALIFQGPPAVAPLPTTCTVGGTITDFGSRTNCWVNDAVGLAALSSGTGSAFLAGTTAASTNAAAPWPGRSANGTILTGADLGSGRIIVGVTTAMATTFTARAAATGTANATIDASTPLPTNGVLVGVPTGLAETGTNNAYQLRIASTDLLGNTRNTGTQTVAGVSIPWQFGVDRTPPALAFGAGNLNGARIFATPPAGAAAPLLLSLLASDVSATAGVGVGSLFFTASGAPMTVTQRATNQNGSFFWCPSTALYQGSGAACANTAAAGTPSNGWATNTTNFLSNFSIATDNHGGAGLTGTSGTNAYYTATATVIDQAGNVSPAFTHLMVEDGTNAAWGGMTYQPAIITPGSTITFGGPLGDDVDIQSVRMSIGFGTNGAPAAGLAVQPIDAATGALWALGGAGGYTTLPGGATFWQPDAEINRCFTPALAGSTGTAASAPYPTALCTVQPTLVNQTNVNYNLAGAITNIQTTSAAVTGAGGAGLAAPGVPPAAPSSYVYNVGNNLMTASGFAFNQAVNLSVAPTIPAITAAMQSTIGISLGAVSPALVALNNGGNSLSALSGVTAAAAAGPTRWVICAVSATGACSNAVSALTDPPSVVVGAPLNSGNIAGAYTISRTGAGGLPTSVSITAVAEGLSALATGAGTIFANPFSSVQFYLYDPTAGLASEGWRLIATVPAGLAQTGDNLAPAPSIPNGRNWYFTTTFTPSVTTAPDNTAAVLGGASYRVVAIGISNQSHVAGQRGVALASPLAWTQILIVP